MVIENQARKESAPDFLKLPDQMRTRVVMKAFLTSIASGCLMAVLLLVMRLPSDSGLPGFLKRGSTVLLLPGTYVGFLFASGKIDDISFVIADFVNFLLYAALFYILSVAGHRHRT